MTDDDIEQIWKRLGLVELRHALVTVVVSAQRFEQALRKLPECDTCARVALLEHIEDSGKTLGSEVINLTALVGTLKKAVAETEKIQEQLGRNTPEQCRCGDSKCNCHSESLSNGKIEELFNQVLVQENKSEKEDRKMNLINTMAEIEEDARELRLTEQAFFRNVICSIKERHKKVILGVVITLAGLALVWGILACPLLHSVHLCPWMR